MNISRTIKTLVCFGFFLCLTSLTAADNLGGPTMGYYLSPEFVGEHAKLIVEVTLDSVNTTMNKGMVWTLADCTVTDVLKGNLEDYALTVHAPGGEFEDFHTEAGPRPNLTPGDKWILALNPSTENRRVILGMIQGAFRLNNGIAERDFSLFSFVERPPVTLEGTVEKLDADELRETLRVAPAPDIDERAENTTTSIQSEKEEIPQTISQQNKKNTGINQTEEKEWENKQKTATDDSPNVSTVVGLIFALLSAVIAFMLLYKRKK